MSHIFEHEFRAKLRERTCNGLKHACSQGRVGGRPPKLSADQENEILDMVASRSKTPAQAARMYGVNRSTTSHIIARLQADDTNQHQHKGSRTMETSKRWQSWMR